MWGSESWVVRGGVVAVAVVVGAGTAWWFEDDGTELTAGAPEEASAAAPTRSVPPTAEELVTAVEVDAGLTSGQVVACNTAGGQASGLYPAAERCAPEERGVIGDGVSYGIVVENTSDRVLIGVPVTYGSSPTTGPWCLSRPPLSPTAT